MYTKVNQYEKKRFQQITAKAESEFVRLTGTNGSGFIPVISEVGKEVKQIGSGTKT